MKLAALLARQDQDNPLVRFLLHPEYAEVRLRWQQRQRYPKLGGTSGITAVWPEEFYGKQIAPYPVFIPFALLMSPQERHHLMRCHGCGCTNYAHMINHRWVHCPNLKHALFQAKRLLWLTAAYARTTQAVMRSSRSDAKRKSDNVIIEGLRKKRISRMSPEQLKAYRKMRMRAVTKNRLLNQQGETLIRNAAELTLLKSSLGAALTRAAQPVARGRL